MVYDGVSPLTIHRATRDLSCSSVACHRHWVIVMIENVLSLNYQVFVLESVYSEL